MSNFYSLLQDTYSEIIYKDLDYYREKKCENNNLSSLDYYAKEFLSLFYKTNIEDKDSLNYYLSLWKYEALLHNVKYAKENTEHYKDIYSQSALDIESLIVELEALKKSNSNSCENIDLLFEKCIKSLPYCSSHDLELGSEEFLAVNSKEIMGVSNLDPTGKAYQVRNADDLEQQKDDNRKKRIYYTAVDLRSMLNFIFFGMQDIIKKKERKILLMMSPGKAKTAGVLFCATMQKLGVECKVITFSTDYAHICKEVLEYKANILFGVPWNLHALSSYIKANNILHTIEIVILNGDTASLALRKQIENNLSCEVYLHYGMTEIGFGGAVECDYHDALHLRMIDLYIEIVDENLQKVKEGEEGEVVITTFTRHAIPLIRYRTGDRGRIVPQECKCDSNMQRIEVQGYIGQGVQINKDLFLHLADFQDFIYKDFAEEIKASQTVDINTYLKLFSEIVIFDFEMCIFKDEEKERNCLLIGLDFNPMDEEKDKLFLDYIANSFSQYLGIKTIEEIEYNSNEAEHDIEAFYITSKTNYSNILQRNAEKQLVEGEDFENSKEQDRAFALSITRLDTFVAAKKVILKVSGRIFEKQDEL